MTLIEDDVSYLGMQPSLTVNLTDTELNELKRITDLATDVSNTWLSVNENGINDVFSLGLVQIHNNDSLQAFNHTPDTTDPVLIDFDIDLNVGTLTLVFDETVDASSLNLTQITLQDMVSGETNNTYTLTGGDWEMYDSTIITVYFSFTDLNSIKRIRGLASYDPNASDSESGFSEFLVSGSGSGSGSGSDSGSGSGIEMMMYAPRNNTYIVITNSTIVDMNLNPVVEIPTTQAMPVRNITLDYTQPQLVSFDFNLDTEQLTLTFDETVDTLTLMLDQFTILGMPYSANYTLTGGFTPSHDDYIIVIQLDVTDINNIKKDFNVAVSEDSTNLFLTSYAILDMNCNLLNFTESKIVRSYQNDTQAPVLISFNLDLNSNELILTFNETIWVDTLEIMEITIQDNVSSNFSNPATFRTLELGVPLTDDDPVLVVSLQPVDTNFIKTYTNLATSESNTYISFSNLTIIDTNENSVIGITAENATQVLNFTADETAPYLVQFELDLTQEEIRFVFDETINASSLNPTRITLHGAEDDDGSYYMLAGGSVLPLVDHTNITLRLDKDDLNEIKRDENLTTSINNSFISFDEYLLVDMNNNMITSMDMPNFTQAFDFVEDKVDPELEFFHLDLTQGILYLTFSETVRSMTLNPSSFVFQSQNDSTNVSYELTSGIPLSSNMPVVTFELSLYDLNNIKRITDLGTDENNTFLSVNTEGIRDINNNTIKAITEDNAQQAELVTPDLKPPKLISFFT